MISFFYVFILFNLIYKLPVFDYVEHGNIWSSKCVLGHQFKFQVNPLTGTNEQVRKCNVTPAEKYLQIHYQILLNIPPASLRGPSLDTQEAAVLPINAIIRNIHQTCCFSPICTYYHPHRQEITHAVFPEAIQTPNPPEQGALKNVSLPAEAAGKILISCLSSGKKRY